MTASRSHRIRRDTAAAAVAALMALTACTTAAAPAPPETRQRSCPSNQVTAGTPAADGRLSTPARLLALADTITAVPDDARDSRVYPYSAVHTQYWQVDGDTIEAHDVVTWRAAGDIARIQTRALTVHRDPTRLPDPLERQSLAAAPAITVTSAPTGTRSDGGITGSIPHDARALADVLAGPHEAACRPYLLFDRYLLLAGGYYLDHAARAATLRMLASIPGLRYDGVARDLAGRIGWIFALTRTDQHTTDTVVLDPATGALLTASTAEIGAAHPRRYTLYLDRGRTTTPDQPPSP